MWISPHFTSLGVTVRLIACTLDNVASGARFSNFDFYIIEYINFKYIFVRESSRLTKKKGTLIRP